MEDKIKTLISLIDLLENEGSDTIESGHELGKLYGKMRDLGWVWNTRIKEWVYDDTTDFEEEDTDEIP